MLRTGFYPALALLALALAAGQALRSQVPADRQWEFATVSKGQAWGDNSAIGTTQWHNDAYACTFGLTNCPKFVADGAGDSAMQKAAAALGEEGWELVAVVATERERNMYFRRPKPARK